MVFGSHSRQLESLEMMGMMTKRKKSGVSVAINYNCVTSQVRR